MNMTMDEKIKRINELYHKSKTEGLNEIEREEQKALRRDYINSVKANLRGQLDNMSILEKDGSITHVRDLKKK